MNHSDVTNDDFNCTLINTLPDGTFMFECFERDVIWAFITWGILFLPGLQLYSVLTAWTTDDENDDGEITEDERASMCTRMGFFLASLFFPASLVCFKASILEEKFILIDKTFRLCRLYTILIP